jgi:uncharacterized membrane protein
MRSLLLGLLTLAYPALIYFGARHFQARWLAVLLAALALARAFASPDKFWRVAAAAALVLAGMSVVGNALMPLQLYPVLVNVVLLVVFAASLQWPPSMIEKLARLQHAELPPAAVLYTRRVTQVWCGFFIVNGAIALWTVLYASAATWAFYNGFLAYLLMACLFAGEYCLRRRLQARLAANPETPISGAPPI